MNEQPHGRSMTLPKQNTMLSRLKTFVSRDQRSVDSGNDASMLVMDTGADQSKEKISILKTNQASNTVSNNNQSLQSSNTELSGRDKRFYSPEDVIEQLKGFGNISVYNEMEIIRPVSFDTQMPTVLEVFRDHPKNTFFPVLDEDCRPIGLIREVPLKEFVYSKFGNALLQNEGLKNSLTQFLDPCPMVEIDARSEEILALHSKSSVTEGIVVTYQGKYLGFLSLNSLVNLAHERELTLIEAHNQALTQKNNDIHNILQNMKQGFFALQENKTIHEDYSLYLESILETSAITEGDIYDLLFSNSDLDADTIARLELGIEATLGEDIMSYEVNEDCFVTSYTKNFDGGRQKSLALFWNPVADDDDVVRKIFVVLKDQTELVELKRQADQRHREFTIINQVLSCGFDNFNQFVESAREYIKNSYETARSEPTASVEALNQIYRNLHTMKGNSRLYELDIITAAIHDAEEQVKQMKDGFSEFQPDRLISALESVDTVVQSYDSVVQEKLGGFITQQPKGVTLDQQLSSLLIENLDVAAARVESNNELFERIVKASQILEIANTTPFKIVIERIKDHLASMASEAGKAEPNMELTGLDIRVDRKMESFLKDAFIHIVRNSLGHGIESESDRLSKGKTATGNIRIDISSNGNMIEVVYQDDGAGLNLEAIKNKALNNALIDGTSSPTDQEIANYIFNSGLSTAEKVDNISGRGVGMDAVRKLLQSIGGEIEIKFIGDYGKDNPRRPFQFVIGIPEDRVTLLN